MIIRRNLTAGLAIAASALMLFAGSASALSIRLQTGANVVTVADGDNDGVVNYNGALGTWTVNVTTGLSDPALGPPLPHLDLNSVNVSGGASTLTIWLTDGGFSPGGMVSLLSAIGGTVSNVTGSSLSAELFAGGAEFAEMTSLGTHGPFGPGGFNNSQNLSGNLSDPYFLTMRVDITHTSGGAVSSFDWNVQRVPEPMTLSLFGLSLLGLGLSMRRKS